MDDKGISIDFSINGVNFNNTSSFGSNPPSSTIVNFNNFQTQDLLTANINIPNNQSTGWYDLEVWDYSTSSWVFASNMFEILEPASVDAINPNTGEQGQNLYVQISTTNMGLGNYSNTSQFRFSQSGSNTFYGSSSYTYGSTLEGYANIPSNQPTGWYDLEVWNNKQKVTN